MVETNAEIITNYNPDIRIRYDGQVAFATGNSKTSKQWKNKNILYSALVEKLSHTTRTPETYAEYKKMPKVDRDRIKDVGGFVGGGLKNGRRKSENVANRTLLTLDLDYVVGDVWASIELLWDFSVTMYSTHTHASDNQRLRLVIPLSRPVLPDEYQAIARMIADDLGIDQFDDTTYEPWRLMYWPSTSSDGDYVFKVQDMQWLNPDDILAKYTFGWEDVSYWPESSRARAKLNSAIKKQEDPLEKKGVIGAFCRTYSISEAIAEFLEDIYTSGADDTRYTYTDGSTSGGLVVYEDKFSFSHHGTDPASGMLCNSFDLIRIHKFGELDDNAKEDTLANRLPSFTRMTEFASSDEKTKLKLIMDDFENVENEDIQEKPEEAINYIQVSQNGGLKVNTGLLAQYIRNNSNYMIVRKHGYDNDLLYWYEKGFYRRISVNELKGRIKSYIPEKIRVPSQWDNVYKDLITDIKCMAFEELDVNEEYINVKNGLFNIKTRELEPHNPDIRSTIQLNCNYNPNVSASGEWIKFIKTLSNNDSQIEAVLQEWFGLAISNIDISKLKKCLILYGAIGDTGKTQYNKMLIHLLGLDFISSTPIQDLSKRFATSNLYGKRMNIVDDQSSINIEDSSIFKALTGGGNIDLEFKGKSIFSYHYRGGLLMCCNDLPYIKDDKGDHVYERMITVPCDNVIPKEKQIKDLINRFVVETDGIFLWALEGLYRLIDNSLIFTSSEAVSRVKEDYKQMNDTIYRFLRLNYEITKNNKDRIKKTDFEDNYTTWICLEANHSGVPKKNIKGRMLKHGIALVEYGHIIYYCGLVPKKTQNTQ